MDDFDGLNNNGTRAKPTNKRRRIAKACETCRQRKSRCDGSHPTCGLCSQQGIECYYRDATTATASAVGSDRQHLSRLETRLREIESMLQTLVPGRVRGNVVSPSPPLRDDETSLWRFDPRSGNSNNNSSLLDPAAVERVSNSRKIAQPAKPQDSVDGMGSITFAGETSSGFFGPTSHSAFLQKIVSAQSVIFGQKENMPSNLADFNIAASRGFSRPSSPPPQPINGNNSAAGWPTVNPYLLPPHHEILRLIDIFFENTGKFFPYLYKPHVLENLMNMRRAGFKEVDRSQLCILYLVLAFATTHCSSQVPVLVKEERGDVFLQMALALIPDIKPAADNLESIQALLLATQYIQGTQRSSQTWEMLGNLVHASFKVGLCQRVAGVECNPLEAELRNRMWWMCFIMDRMCSMTYGRPPLMPNMYMTADLPADVELGTLAGDSSGDVDAGSISTPSLLIYTSKLYLVLGSVIEKVYGNNISSPTNEVPLHPLLTRVLEVEQDLSTWTQGLPEALFLVTASDLDRLGVDDSEAHRFRVILTLRFLNVRILLHRMNRDFMLMMSAGSLGMCVDAAVETIAIISRTTQRQHVLPIWWYSIYFAFSAALVVYSTMLAIRKCNLQVHRYSSQDLFQSLQTALDVLGKLGGDTRQVVRCQKIVRHLLKAAWALGPKPGVSQKGMDSSTDEGVTQEHGDVRLLTTELASNPMGGDVMSAIDFNFPLEPYSFTEDMSSLFSSGFIM